MNHHDKNNDLGIGRLAIHEAGHVAVALYLGCAVSDVSIIPGDISDGCVNTPDIDSWSLKQAALFKIAGVVAEQIIFGEADEHYHYRSDRRDLETIHRLERKKGDTLHISFPRYVIALEATCRAILTDPFCSCLLRMIGTSLDKQKFLNSGDLQEIFDSCKTYGTAALKIE